MTGECNLLAGYSVYSYMSIQRINRGPENLRFSLTNRVRSASRAFALTAVVALSWAGQLAAQPSESETEQILFLKEEEKLARDVYMTLGTKWDLRVFQNIARSEQVHMDQVDTLLAAYGLTDPAFNEIGRFQNPLLQHLYDRLTSEGSISLRTALGVGEFIEIIDIKDLEVLIASTDAPLIIGVAERLLAGSINHLAAFNRQLDLLPDALPAVDPSSNLVNLSARGILGEDEEALIGGFVIEGTGTLRVLLDVRGPSLSAYGVSDPAQNPVLKLFHGDEILAVNDSWSDAVSAAFIADAGLFEFAPTEAAVLVDLSPGAYTFVTENRGAGSTGLIEVFGWSDPAEDIRLANLSVRGQTGSGESRLIAGFIVEGAGPLSIAVRALGPTLSSYGVANVVEQPVLKIYQETEHSRDVGDWIHANVLGVVPSLYWPESILEPLDVILQNPGAVTIHAIDQTEEGGIVLIDVTLFDPR